MRPSRVRATLTAALVALLMGLAPLSAGTAAPAPADDISAAALGLLPSVEDAALPLEDSPAASPEASPEPSASVTAPATTPPTASTTPTPTEPSTTAPTSTSATTSASPDTSASASADQGITWPVGLPLLLGLGALLALVGAVGWLLAGSARKRRWDSALEVERTQARWVTEELVPALADPTAPVHELVGHWSAAQPTLDQLQTNLAGLASQAPDDRRAASVALMSTASAQVRSSGASLLSLAGGSAPDPQSVAAARAALLSASAQLAGASTPRH